MFAKRYTLPLLLLFGFLTTYFGASSAIPLQAGNGQLVYLPVVFRSPPPAYKLAFYLQDATGWTGIYQADPNAQNRVGLTTGQNAAFAEPTWSADAQRLAFHLRDGSEEMIWYVASNQPSPNLIVNTFVDLPGGVSMEDGITWAPDSTHVAFATTGAAVDIFAAPLDRSGLINLTREPADTLRNNYDPDWSPDGNSIIFASRNLEDDTIYGSIDSVTPDGQTRSTLYGPVANHRFYEPTFSPDGSQIAFVDTEAPFSAFSGQLVVMDADGRNLRRFGAPFPLQTGVHWSPDGTQIAFIGEGDMGSIRPFALNLEDGTVRQSLLSADFNSTLTWSDDGTQLIFDAPESDISIRNLYRYDLNSNLTTPLTNGQPGDRYRWPTWSPVPTRR